MDMIACTIHYIIIMSPAIQFTKVDHRVVLLCSLALHKAVCVISVVQELLITAMNDQDATAEAGSQSYPGCHPIQASAYLSLILACYFSS
ncbi:hypothetical protein RHMOL_Rhmol03G0056000 [Rhododendron molle]|uniref:Uncharacterized protein n=1 Tax=Rhododendron molle TaxID=49168 RepID=A0ACC0PAM2_RHOML|nr:hypothetical protein RHMOL_Rhmol03G0056000 [Rhododendron molle]